jgi:homoserine dehydrogenase
VQVERLEPSDFLAGAEGAESRFELSLANGDVVCLRGQGAGREAATTAVMGDLLELRREWAASQRAAAADGVYP